MDATNFLRALLLRQAANDAFDECLSAEPDSPEARDASARMCAASDEEKRVIWSQPSEAEQFEMCEAVTRWWSR